MMRATAPGELDGSGDVYHVSGFAWRRDHGRPLDQAPHALREEEVFSACGGAVMYRREAFVRLGGFDETLLRLPRGHRPRLPPAARGPPLPVRRRPRSSTTSARRRREPRASTPSTTGSATSSGCGRSACPGRSCCSTCRSTSREPADGRVLRRPRAGRRGAARQARRARRAAADRARAPRDPALAARRRAPELRALMARGIGAYTTGLGRAAADGARRDGAAPVPVSA